MEQLSVINRISFSRTKLLVRLERQKIQDNGNIKPEVRNGARR